MTPEQAAHSLDEELRKYPWYLSVGVDNTPDDQTLFVYVKSAKRRELRSLSDGWMGYKVIIRPVGAIKPLKVEKVRPLGVFN